jgi:hypothetical protein
MAGSPGENPLLLDVRKINPDPITEPFLQLMLNADWSRPNKELAEVFHVHKDTITRYRKFYNEHLHRQMARRQK